MTAEVLARSSQMLGAQLVETQVLHSFALILPSSIIGIQAKVSRKYVSVSSD